MKKKKYNQNKHMYTKNKPVQILRYCEERIRTRLKEILIIKRQMKPEPMTFNMKSKLTLLKIIYAINVAF